MKFAIYREEFNEFGKILFHQIGSPEAEKQWDQTSFRNNFQWKRIEYK